MSDRSKPPFEIDGAQIAKEYAELMEGFEMTPQINRSIAQAHTIPSTVVSFNTTVLHFPAGDFTVTGGDKESADGLDTKL